MSRATQSESTNTSLVHASHAPGGNARRLQFSISALMLATLVVAVACAVIPWLGSVWVVPCGLAGLSAANLILAVLRRSNWRMLKLGHIHMAIWLAFAAASTGFAVHGCLNYNTIAGTDKTRGHIIQISAAVLAGPMVGPVANSAATSEIPAAWKATA